MSSTHLSLHCHIVFSTKERRAFIDERWIGRLHAYLGGIVRSKGGVPEAIGGVADHVHLMVGLRATHRLADLVRDMKSASSDWVHQEIRKPIFGWQDGYGAFSVSASKRAAVRRYIENQPEHHRHIDFKDEYRKLLLDHGIEFDERFLW